MSTTSYAVATANLQVDTEASPHDGGASASFAQTFPVESADCGDRVDLDWFPDYEQAHAPAAIRRLCGGCEARYGCLLWATVNEAPGYWAGTTTAQREAVPEDERTPAGATRLLWALHQQEAGAQEAAATFHEPGRGSRGYYRKGCVCDECRTANAEAKRAERQRARARASAGDAA